MSASLDSTQFSGTFRDTPENQQLAERIFLDRLEECVRFPKYFEVETVNACNARCKMCTINDWTRGENVMMPMELIEKLAREIEPHADWIEQICLNRDGEPTLDKKLAHRVELLKDAGAKKVTFTTNGQLMDEAFIRGLCQAGLDDIVISIDGSTKETFEAIRIRLDFDVVVANTLRLIELRNQLRPEMTIRIRAIVMPENKHEITDLIAFWKDKLTERDPVYAMPMHSWGNQHFAEDTQKVAYYADKPCVSPFSTMVIDVDGKIPLCGCDFDAKEQLGDFSSATIDQIWRGEPYTRVRALHAGGNRNDLWLCRGCDIWDRSILGRKEDNDRPAPQEFPDEFQNKETLVQISNFLDESSS